MRVAAWQSWGICSGIKTPQFGGSWELRKSVGFGKRNTHRRVIGSGCGRGVDRRDRGAHARTSRAGFVGFENADRGTKRFHLASQLLDFIFFLPQYFENIAHISSPTDKSWHRTGAWERAD